MLPIAEEYCLARGLWRTPKFIKAGKTASVFRVESDTETAALKVFEPGFICGETAPIQVSRLHLQRDHLLGVQHPGLIAMLDTCLIDRFQTWAILMEYLPWSDLEDQTATFPPDALWTVIEKLADAAKWLEERNLVHRDIKPSNILVSPKYDSIKLLDFGVLRRSDTFDGSGTPNEGEYRFVATRRYSSPRYLFGHPMPDLNAAAAADELVRDWRALTFYQMGGVLHDLIMGVPLFQDSFERYGGNRQAALEQAVMTEIPVIENPRVDPRLIDLARDCLDKEDASRLKHVDWNRFARTAPTVSMAISSARELLESPALAQWDALQMAMRAVLQEVLDVARDFLAQQRGEAIRTRIYPVEPFVPRSLLSVVSHKWHETGISERVLLHLFEVGGSPEATEVIIRYGAVLASSWNPKFVEIQLVPVATIGGPAVPSCDFCIEIQRLIAETLKASIALLSRLENLQDKTDHIDIWSK